MSKREDGRLDDELGPVVITRSFTSHPAAAVGIGFSQRGVFLTAQRHRRRAALAEGVRLGLAHHQDHDAPVYCLARLVLLASVSPVGDRAQALELLAAF